MSSVDNKGSQLLVVKDDISFVQDEIQLKKLLRELDRASKEAVEVLLKCTESQDERIRMQAAMKLIEFKIDVTAKMNADKMQRMIAEIKVAKGGGNGKLVEDDSPKRPMLDFNNIQEV